MAEYSLAELAERFDCRLIGPGDALVSGVCPLSPGRPGCVGFLAAPGYRRLLRDTQAAAVILRPEDAPLCPVPALVTDRPHLAFAELATLLHPPEAAQQGCHPTAIIDPTASIHPRAEIGPHCVIEAAVEIGEGVVLGPQCVVRRHARIADQTRLVARVYIGPEVRLGRRCIVHPGAVIGADGFGFAQDGERWLKVPQLGTVQIGDDVEIGANTTVDRGALEDTVIEDGVKLDNQIQIGHNVKIGRHTAIAACTGISGSTVIGERCMIGGGVGMSGHLQIAGGVVITGMTMVTHSLRAAGVYSSGIPADANRRWQRNAARFRHLDELADRVRRLERSETGTVTAIGSDEEGSIV